MGGIYDLINRLRSNSGAIWIENDVVRLIVPKNLQTTETRNFIKNNRDEVRSILNENKVFSKQDFINTQIFKHKNKKFYELSFSQERLWFIDKYNQGASAYHIPFLLELNAGVDVSGVKHALEQIVLRHEVLRSTIDLGDDGEGIQVVHDAPLLIEEEHLSIREDYEKAISVEMGRSFNLKEEYPLRVKFYHIKSEIASDGTEKVLLLFNLHHVAGDGWSVGILQKELIAYYEAYVGGDKGFSLPSLGIQYKDYAVWQRGYLSGEVLEQQLSYWKDKLSGFETLELPTDYSRPIQIDYKGARRNFSIDRETSAGLRALAMKHGTTLHAVMLSSLGILLSKYSNQNDIVIGSPIANRQYEQTKDLVGFFVNTQVNRLLLDKDQSYADLIVQTQRDQIKAQQYQDLPFERLVDELRVERDLSRNPIFQVMFDVHSYGPAPHEGDQHFKHFQGDVSYSVEKFDLSIFIEDGHDELLGSISYATSLFHEDTINRMITHYTSLLTQLVSTPDKPYSELSLLGADEYDRVVHEWNETDADYPADKTIHELFEEQVEKTPDNVALVYEGEELSYRELNEKSNQLARHIRMKYKEQTGEELKSDTLIGLYVDRSLEMVIGIMAVLKAGGAYVPIDVDYPQERINYILSDTKTCLILSQRRLKERKQKELPEEKVLYVDLSEDLYTVGEEPKPFRYNKSTDLAYVIYTSGTTGRPKGVLVTQKNILNILCWFQSTLDLRGSDSFLSNTNYTFDISVLEYLLTLCNGAKLIISTSDEKYDLSYLSALFEQHEPTYFQGTPTILSALLGVGWNGSSQLTILSGGEPLPLHLSKELLNSNKSLFNLYGPAETTIWSAYHEIKSEDEKVMIGRPIGNTKIFIINEYNELVPIGAIGEICISGDGVSKGYLNRQVETQKNFIEHPLNKGSKLYRTGDLGRWNRDGNLEFLGRRDSQVKIRGYRIELGEVESVLGSQPGVNQCVVVDLDREQGEKYLVGYVVSAGGSLDVEVLRSGLQKELPDYMVPSVLMELAELPLTINGKLDRKGLPAPKFENSEKDYVAPITEIETLICKIWEDVLGLERVGIEDDFFTVGGNSLLALKVSHQITDFLSYEVSVADIFKYRTPSKLVEEGLVAKRIDIPRIELERTRLSFSQERLWFIEKYDQEVSAYHIPFLLELNAGVDVSGVKHALEQIVLRHEVLRSTIDLGEDGEGIQVVHDAPLLIEEEHLSIRENYEKAISVEMGRSFNLKEEYPLRVKFYHIKSEVAFDGTEKVLLLFNLHHVAGDGWSAGILQKELIAYYEAYVGGDKGFSLPSLGIQYKDYAVWQRGYLSGEVLEQQLSYWKDKLSGFETLELPTDYSRPIQIDYKGAQRNFSIDGETSAGLRALAMKHGTTLHAVMLSSLGILLSKYSNQNDIVIGSPIANRQYEQTKDLVGFFVNTQVNRLLLDKDQSYADLIVQTQRDQIKAQQYQDLPFERLVDELRVERDLSRNPIFQVMFDVHSYGPASHEGDQHFKHFQGDVSYSVEKFDLSIFIEDGHDELLGSISYATSLFHEDTINRMITHYTSLLTQLVSTPDKPYSELSLLGADEYDRVVHEWNETDADYPADKTIYELFEEQVAKTPDHIALVYEGEELSYRELNEKSNQLARHIRMKYKEQTGEELKSDTLIGLYVDRSMEMVIGIMAVLKAGGAYVPLSPDYPEERVKYMLDDSSSKLLITEEDYVDRLQGWLGGSVTLLLPGDVPTEMASDNLEVYSGPEDLAYVIYTSGTTGKPKGVTVEHKNVLRLFIATDHQFGFNDQDVWTLFHSYVFDFSVWELWGALLNGGKLLVVTKDQTKDLESFYCLCRDYRVSVLSQTPSAFYRFIDVCNKFDESVLSLRYIILGGEALATSQLDNWWSYHSRHRLTTKLINMYGITETTVHVTYKELVAIETVVSNIGKPLEDLKAYVLDSFLNPVPIGVVGELHIGGAGLARGYLNNDELTSERFIANPFATESDREKGYTRLYKTGDLVRWLPDGDLEYLGRNDDQVKIRGYRIELGEVEHSLSKVPGIKQCCVLALERKLETGVTKYLAGYYVLDEGVSLLEEDIRRQLLEDLPDYMVPMRLVKMESFSLTMNGKLDKRSLPEPDFDSLGEEYVAPTNEFEILICKIWEDVLGLERVGVQDDFLKIGGNSLLALKVSHQITDFLSYEVSVADIFKYRTPSKLVEEGLVAKRIDIPRIELERTRLSFSQERLWFIEKYNQEVSAYHIPFLLELNAGVDVSGVKHALEQIVLRHEVLRSTIDLGDDGEGIQVVHDAPLLIEEEHLSIREDYEKAISVEMGRSFNLKEEYPLRVKFYHIKSEVASDGTEKVLLLFNLHHVAGDGWSAGILQKELIAYYEAYVGGDKGFSLPSLGIQYKDYAVWQRGYLSGEVLEQQLSYWKDKLSGFETLELPTDYSRPIQIDYKGARRNFSIDRETSAGLRALAMKHGTTLHAVMLSSLGILLSKYSNQNDIVIGSPIANRQYEQTKDLVGFFVNTQVNRLLLDKDQSYADLIVQTQRDQIKAQQYQDLPFERLVDELRVERDLSRNPIFQVMFDVHSYVPASNEGDQHFKHFQGDVSYSVEKFDLSIFIEDGHDELLGSISYATSLFHEDTINRMITHYTSLLTQLVSTPDKPYSELSLLGADEYDRVVHEWNETEADYPADKTIHELFEEQVEKTPDNVALVYEGEELSYRELNEKSNQLARHIRMKYKEQTGEELKSDTLIGLYVDRSMEMVIGIMAVLKAGGAYVPLSPDYPEERVKYMLDDSSSKLLITEEDYVERLQGWLGGSITLLLPGDAPTEMASDNLEVYSGPEDLAYVIYTSGTTGKPKGVMIEHRSVSDLAAFICKTHKISDKTRSLFFSDYIFDASVMELFPSLLSGSPIFIAPESTRKDSLELLEFISTHAIEKAFLPTAITLALSEKLADTTLQVLHTGGDRLSRLSHLPAPLTFNQYGPTESTVLVTQNVLNDSKDVGIGKPVSNSRLYVLDSSGHPVPIGVVGELYIGGAGLARGYLNNAELTSERFIANPFATESDKEKGYTRLYKTGDMVRWLADGNLEFLGRRDSQVKIRGYRIELGEVESVLGSQPGVNQCVVVDLDREQGEKYLVGYVVSAGGSLDVEDLRLGLQKELPDYMVPSVLMELAELPLTINGKLDRKGLPDPVFKGAEYVSPRNELEAQLCKIWEELLGLERVGIEDDFFRIGGSSLKALKLVEPMRQYLETFKVTDLFSYPTIRSLIDNTSNTSTTLSEQQSEIETFDL